MKSKIKILNIEKGLAQMKKDFQFLYATNFGRISESNSNMKELGEISR